MKNIGKVMNQKTVERNNEDLKALEEVKSGKTSSYEFIYNRYFRYVQYKCYLSTRDQQIADDLAIEILTKVYFNLDKFNSSNTFNSWVTSIAKNHLMDYLRKKPLEPIDHNKNSSITNNESREDDINTGMTFANQLKSDVLDPEEQMQKRSAQNLRKEFVMNLLSGMKERDRKIIMHYYFDQMSYEEIAQKLDISLSVMKVALMRGKEKLKNKIGSYSNIAHLFA